MRLFVDMDGTLAVFHPVDTLETLYEKGYFENLQPLENVVGAVKETLHLYPETEVYILSSYLSDSPYALTEKNAWLDKHLPELPKSQRIFCPCGQDKKDFVPGGIRPNDFLLDDYSHNLRSWEPPAKAVKLLNGVNGQHGTWQKAAVSYDLPPQDIATNLLKIMEEPTMENSKILTAQQQEYFRESKVRDDDGVLLPVYHGASQPITQFSPEYTGNGQDFFGSGFYFTTSKETAQGYASESHLVTAYVNLKNPLVIDGKEHENLSHISVAAEHAHAILQHLPSLYTPLDIDASEPNPLGDFMESIWEDNPQTVEEFELYIKQLADEFFTDKNLRDFDILFANHPTEFRQALKDVLGYDGVVVKFPTEKHVVAWFPEQIKDIRNANPQNTPLLMDKSAELKPALHTAPQPLQTQSSMAQALDMAKNITESYERNPQLIADFLHFRAKHNFYNYSVRNTMMIEKQNPGAMFVASFNKWKEMGHSVLKGQHGMKVLVPAKVTLFKPDGAVKYKKLSQATRQEKALIQSGQIRTVVKNTYTIGRVFDIAQTNFPKERYPELISPGLSSEKHAQAYENLKAYLQEQGVSVREQDLTSAGLRGLYNADTHDIAINHLLNDTEKLSTLCHEAGHAFYEHNHHKNIPTSVCECQADAFAICLQAHMGFALTEGRKNHFKEHFDACRNVPNFTADSLLKDVSDKFSSVWPQMEQHLQPVLNPQQTIQPQTQATGITQQLM